MRPPAIGHLCAAAPAAGVAPERQKIMVKGGMLKDEQEWSKAGVKPGQKLMMMGTAEAVPQAPAAQQVSAATAPPHPGPTGMQAAAMVVGCCRPKEAAFSLKSCNCCGASCWCARTAVLFAPSA